MLDTVQTGISCFRPRFIQIWSTDFGQASASTKIFISLYSAFRRLGDIYRQKIVDMGSWISKRRAGGSPAEPVGGDADPTKTISRRRDHLLEPCLRLDRRKKRSYLPIKYSWMELAAFRPAPMAKMTVAEPVTISPPAQTPGLLVFPVSRSATI